jgi:O-antigen/teichoic acid export membrane protein
MTALRYIDLVLLWLTVPVALALGAPTLGLLLGAVVWTVQRLIALEVDRRAVQRENVREAIGLNLATMFARLWLVCTTIVVAGVGGAREDGVAAAAVLLIAFTISLVSTLVTRALTRTEPRPGDPTPA